MMTLSIMSLMIMSCMIFLTMNHPLAMGLNLLIHTLLTCLFTGMISKSFWFSYILFLIFLGGMLVLFIYVTALASNEMFSLPMKSIFMWTLYWMMMTTMIMIMDKQLTNFPIENTDQMIMSSMTPFFNPENTIMLMKLYNLPTNMITIMLMIYLLITLVATVKITNAFFGPLRKLN
nr:NADH dehydrogenase subunit 6 [Clephydroneura sp.]